MEVNLGASVKPYDVHVILYTERLASTWAAKFGSEIRGYDELKEAKKRNPQFNSLNVAIHICEDTTVTLQSYTVFCATKFGSYLITNLQLSDFDNMFNFILDANPRDLMVEKQITPYFFVCCHTNRDDRCGYCGLRIFQKFLDEMNEKQIHGVVKKISHVGGHVFAANVISYPSGDWFGNVKPSDVERILNFYSSNLEDRKILGDIWRGRMGMSHEEQLSITPHPSLKSPKKKKKKDKGKNNATDGEDISLREQKEQKKKGTTIRCRS